LRGEARQKQIVEATSLLLQIAQDLRKEIASQPSAEITGSERTRLEHIQKLAHMIRDREKTEDDISANLAKAGVL
jgi:DNA-directed RNA polymerase subunit F